MNVAIIYFLCRRIGRVCSCCYCGSKFVSRSRHREARRREINDGGLDLCHHVDAIRYALTTDAGVLHAFGTGSGRDRGGRTIDLDGTRLHGVADLDGTIDVLREHASLQAKSRVVDQRERLLVGFGLATTGSTGPKGSSQQIFISCVILSIMSGQMRLSSLFHSWQSFAPLLSASTTKDWMKSAELLDTDDGGCRLR